MNPNEKRKGRDLFAENRAIHQSAVKNAIGRRCFTCSGPIENGAEATCSAADGAIKNTQ